MHLEVALTTVSLLWQWPCFLFLPFVLQSMKTLHQFGMLFKLSFHNSPEIHSFHITPFNFSHKVLNYQHFGHFKEGGTTVMIAFRAFLPII